MSEQLWQYQSLFEPVSTEAAAEDVTLDKWFAQSPTPVEAKPQAYTETVFIPVSQDAESVRVDKWLTQLPTPIAGDDSRLTSGVFVAEPADVSAVNLDWLQSPPTPIESRSWRPAGDVFQPLEPSLITVTPDLAWYQPASEPVRTPEHTTREGYDFAPLEPSLRVVVPDLSWHQQTSEPVLPSVAPLTHGVFVAEPTDFATTVAVDWLQTPSMPVVVDEWRPSAFEIQPLEPSLRTVTPDLAWFQEASRPVPPPHQTRPGQHIEPLEPSLIVVVVPLSWWQPVSEPIFIIPPAQGEGSFVQVVAALDTTLPVIADTIDFTHTHGDTIDFTHTHGDTIDFTHTHGDTIDF